MKKFLLILLPFVMGSTAYASITYTIDNNSSDIIYMSPYAPSGNVTPPNNSYNEVDSTKSITATFGDSGTQKYISVLAAGNASAPGCIVYRYSNMNSIFPINSGTCANVKFSNNVITVSGPVK